MRPYRVVVPPPLLGQGLHNRLVVQLPFGPYRLDLTGMFIDHRQHAGGPAIHRPVHDKFAGPDMVSLLGPEADAGTVIQPEFCPFGLLKAYVEPLAAPGPVHTLVVQMPDLVPEPRRDPAVAIAAYSVAKFRIARVSGPCPSAAPELFAGWTGAVRLPCRPAAQGHVESR